MMALSNYRFAQLTKKLIPCVINRYQSPQLCFQNQRNFQTSFQRRNFVRDAFEEMSNRTKSILVVIGAFTSYGLASYYFNKYNKPDPMLQEFDEEDFILKEKPPTFPPARVINVPGFKSGIKFTLYQFQTCPFCCKARAFLDYFGFNYTVIEVNSVTRKQTKWSSVKKVPMLVMEMPDGSIYQLQDSSLIISVLSSFYTYPDQEFVPLMQCYPKKMYKDEKDNKVKMDFTNKYFLMFKDLPSHRTKEDITNERQWRQWVDKSLVHMLSPNVYRTLSESMETFKWFEECGDWKNVFSVWERYLVLYVGSLAMWLISKRLKKRHGLKDDVRQSLYDDCNKWVKAIKERNLGRFMGGKEPNLADISVYGCLSAIEGCSAFEELLQNTQIGPWFYATKAAVANHDGQVNDILRLKV